MKNKQTYIVIIIIIIIIIVIRCTYLKLTLKILCEK